MPTTAERNAAFNAVKPHIMNLVPAMFRGYVTDDVVLRLCDDALNAAEAARAKSQKASK